MTPISIVIISLNEAHIIEKCLIAASKITDDVVVIDSGSTDDTVQIAKKYTSKVYSEKWKGYGPTRNLGADKAHNDWIFSLDCDEVPDRQLIETLKNEALESGFIYKVSFKSNFWGQWMKFGGLRPDYRKKIYQKSRHKWNDNKVHERLTSEKQTPTKKLKGLVMHYNYDSLADMRGKLDGYAQLSAEHLLYKKKSPALYKILFAQSFRFIKTYFLQLGFLDGKRGWYYAIESALMVRKRYRYYRKLIS